MRRIVALLVVAALLMGAKPASAGPAMLGDGVFVLEQRDRNVEPFTLFGQPVVNPTSCAWDFDDHGSYLRGGALDAGASVRVIACLIANENPLFGVSWAIHPNWRFAVWAPRPLDVTVCYDPGICLPLSITDTYRYEACTAGPFYGHESPAIQTIPDSNGGWGVPTTVTLTVTNPGNHRVRNIYVQIVGGNDANQCPGIPRVAIPGPNLATFWSQTP
jgi:hypothetical protein